MDVDEPSVLGDDDGASSDTDDEAEEDEAESVGEFLEEKSGEPVPDALNMLKAYAATQSGEYISSRSVNEICSHKLTSKHFSQISAGHHCIHLPRATPPPQENE